MSPIRLRIQQNIIWYDIWKEIDTALVRIDKLEPYLLTDLQTVGLTTKDIKNYSWIINADGKAITMKMLNTFANFCCPMIFLVQILAFYI